MSDLESCKRLTAVQAEWMGGDVDSETVTDYLLDMGFSVENAMRVIWMWEKNEEAAREQRIAAKASARDAREAKAAKDAMIANYELERMGMQDMVVSLRNLHPAIRVLESLRRELAEMRLHIRRVESLVGNLSLADEDVLSPTTLNIIVEETRKLGKVFSANAIEGIQLAGDALDDVVRILHDYEERAAKDGDETAS